METMKEPCGVLVVHKPQGVTSHDVVGKVRRLYHTRKVGHTGTLDPMATGVLVVLIGRAAKAAEYLTVKKKSYRAALRLGITTDTEDITGHILTQSDCIPTTAQVIETAASFVGEIMQVPPMYSALKQNGQKLVDLARRGITVERKSRPVTIYSMDCKPLENGDFGLDVTCSAGTYIRTLCADIGASLGCGGVMSALCRTAAGTFSLADAVSPEQLEDMTEEERLALLSPVESLFADLPALCLPAFYERLCRNGCEIYQAKIGTAYETGARVRLCDTDGNFFALGEMKEYENGTAVKGIKYFDI